MSPYKTFAIVGFGYTGSVFAKQFADHKEDNLKWKILSRSVDKSELREAESQGAELIAVDYNSQDSLTTALAGVDIVLSTLRDGGLEDVQLNLVRAAKLLVSTFSFLASMEEIPWAFLFLDAHLKIADLKPKAETHALLKELNLLYALFFTGLWPSMALDPTIAKAIGLDFEAGKFTFFGDGNAVQSWTAPVDFAAFVYYVLTTRPACELENKVFQIEGDSKSIREVVTLWEKKSGRKAEIHQLSEEEIQAFISRQEFELYRFLPHQLKYGGLKVTGESNGIWPEWNSSQSKWEFYSLGELHTMFEEKRWTGS
ncbi:hypothetical protein M422DRAFT_266333 [Sphaerobolus stellatus SS14]|uniref:NAD(P)-binding domain-containing protein n=1 Tax=Sphaerobolus stellatus (strain SS14) TaxID=990650 RepID=A0A0C9US02_SPHS4|nr:hypothetical protein M422DRAFT_266333 [Sphaerobolus stellatus SS14]